MFSYDILNNISNIFVYSRRMAASFETIAKRFAKKEGFDGVEYQGQWEGQEVFCATSKEPVYIGLPPYILVSGGSARWPSAEEEDKLFELF